MLCHGTVCVVGKIRDLILQLSKSSIYSTKPLSRYNCPHCPRAAGDLSGSVMEIMAAPGTGSSLSASA
ncbi:hypothetical protein B4U29_05095 [Klebsiella pneumoniae]|nr:hypothetical protein B4U29_05095 [Klebsiella pneumoniae]